MIQEFSKGFKTALRHIFRPRFTVEYPEVHREQPPFFRGRHRLQRYANGLERCVGCALCAAVCPSEAIYLEAAENDPDNPVSAGERYAKVYEIHLLRCIYCGFCEEACPEDAIVMGPLYELATDSRQKLIADKETLLDPPEKGFGDPHELDPYVSHITPESDKEAITDPWTS
jgi:NADH-quinone oxidoreductase subunit I